MNSGLADPSDARGSCGVGAVVDLDGGPSHGVVADALELLGNLDHRGARGAEADTGDGAGVMIQRPDDLLAAVVDVELPDVYAVGSLFLPRDDRARTAVRGVVEDALTDRGLTALAWRDVPTDPSVLGATARDSEPHVAQVVVAPEGETDDDEFDRRCYLARNAMETAVSGADVDDERFHVVSLDRRTLVYKGLLTAGQLPRYYPDLADERLASELAVVHARFSTNTLGAWHLAHPYRRLVHNGEINTIRGNVNWMRARETDLDAPGFSDADLDAVRPVTTHEGSDTASLDAALELLTASGRSLPHALRMLVPEAFERDDAMAASRRDWYDFHASLVEPWDGPALVLGCDGDRLAGVLDRNGLRPCRYERRTDGRLVLASEAGALEADPGSVCERGRLRPGETFVADVDAGELRDDDEVFADLTDPQYGEWVAEHRTDLAALDAAGSTPAPGPDLRARQAAHGYTLDSLDELVEPMARDGVDPVGSMGDDTPLSVLANRDRPLFSYFKQLFAQVSNPPIDYIREELVTSLSTRLGRQRNLLGESPDHARQIVADSPVLTGSETAALRDLDGTDTSHRSAVLDATFDPDAADLAAAVERLRADAARAVRHGADVVVLSDRATGPDRAPVPSLLATGAVHHHLVREGLRARTGLVVEAGDACEVHHLACLVGYGAGAVHPHLAYESVVDLVDGDDGPDPEAALSAYREALEGGLLKTMARMGISTVASYRGAQIFEAVGLDSGFVADYFEGTEIRTEGVGVDAVGERAVARHARGFGDDDVELDRNGEYEHRSDGFRHGWNPHSVNALQRAARGDDADAYDEFAALADDEGDDASTLRGLLAFDADRDPVPVEEVEPVASVAERFSTAAMSLGSLSPEAHETNAVAMNRVGGKANTGEGGEPPERYGTERECAVKQVASGRFGVTAEYLASADELQIKMAQGSKPGEGGHLPGHKVTETIADVRCSTPGVDLISPPPQHDIYSIEDLKQLIHDLKAANDAADVNVKLVSEAGIGTIAAGVAKAGADVIHVSGHSGGTGASPRTSIKNVGLPWELGLAEANQLLRATGLRDRVRLSVDGGLRTGRDVAVAALLGAEEYVFGTASLVTAGCVMARNCHKNTCPVGVATQDPELRERFAGQPEHVVNYVRFLAEDLRAHMAEMGFRTVEEMVGRVDCLRQRDTDHPTARHLDLSAVLADPVELGADPDGDRTNTGAQAHRDVADHFDRDLLDDAAPAVERGRRVRLACEVTNRDRAVGTLLSNRVVGEHGGDGLPDDTLRVDLRGTAGQSLGAFLAPGVTLALDGVANDYVGKGLSGGRLVVAAPDGAGYDPADNTAVGNVALYGATDGECYVEGVAGERFAVRNSGAAAVVEGVGDHGCEYMTGGLVAVLGDVGRNFAAGMSGGVAYVHDPDEALAERANAGSVTLSRDLSARDERTLRRLVANHAAHTGSDRAHDLLADWDAALGAFVRVLPDAYAEAVDSGRPDVRTEPPARPETAAHSRPTPVTDDD